MDRIFIVMYGNNTDWIMGKIAQDIMTTAIKCGCECKCGNFEEYSGEEICYHLSYHESVPIPHAKHNSVFYTHLNDIFTEDNLIRIKDKFDSFVCMSPEDAQFLIELGFPPSKVYGKILPVRNTYIKPISIGIFSACYSDGRKNESWLLDYCKKNSDSKYVNFVFIGRGWGRVCDALEELGCTYEWHNVSRKLPYEYQFQQNKLAFLNYYIYMGMDGGAMGTYDAYAQDVPLCVTFDGYHKAIPALDYSFDDEQTFFEKMDEIISSHKARLDFFNSNTPDNYVKWLIDVWHGKGLNVIADYDKKCISYNTIVDKKRDQYYESSWKRLRRSIQWRLSRVKFEKLLKVLKWG